MLRGASPVDGRLIQALEEFRDRVGMPVRINSGFRCLVYYRRVGSPDSSQHPRGDAADIGRLPGMAIDDMIVIADRFEAFANGGIGRYESFIHVDVRPNGPKRWAG